MLLQKLNKISKNPSVPNPSDSQGLGIFAVNLSAPLSREYKAAASKNCPIVNLACLTAEKYRAPSTAAYPSRPVYHSTAIDHSVKGIIS